MIIFHTNMLGCSLIQTSFRQFPFCGPHKKTHGVIRLSKHYHIWFDTKLERGTCVILKIPCVYYWFTPILYKPWIPGFPPQQQPRYQSVIDFTYWPVPGSFNNCNIIILSHKATTSEYFEDIHQVVIYGISDNMALLVQYCKYCAINSTYYTTMVYWVIKFVSEAYNI